MNSLPNSNSVSVEVRDLHKSFDGKEVLKGISFKVGPGERFVIMGPSGSGKSILLKQIIGLMTSDSGEILIDGESAQDPAVRAKYRMAMVFQSAALMTSLSVAENVGLYLSEHHLKTQAEIDKIVADALKTVGLEGKEDDSPSQLSGGEQKRVAIARALVIEPQLVLFDEPTSELDPLMAVTIGQEILNLNERIHATSIIVTHDRELAFATGHHIAMINDGRILFMGTPQQVQQSTDPLIKRFITAELAPPKPH